MVLPIKAHIISLSSVLCVHMGDNGSCHVSFTSGQGKDIAKSCSM